MNCLLILKKNISYMQYMLVFASLNFEKIIADQ